MIIIYRIVIKKSQVAENLYKYNDFFSIIKETKKKKKKAHIIEKINTISIGRY